jgi:hypothetical protein
MDALTLYATSSGARSENLDVSPGRPTALILGTDPLSTAREPGALPSCRTRPNHARAVTRLERSPTDRFFAHDNFGRWRREHRNSVRCAFWRPPLGRRRGRRHRRIRQHGSSLSGWNCSACRDNPSKETYRPGETARIDFQASSQAALGVAIVDQSVFERAETDSDLPDVGSVSQEDLLRLDPTRIDDDYQLLARTRTAAPSTLIEDDIGWVKQPPPLKWARSNARSHRTPTRRPVSAFSRLSAGRKRIRRHGL